MPENTYSLKNPNTEYNPAKSSLSGFSIWLTVPIMIHFINGNTKEISSRRKEMNNEYVGSSFDSFLEEENIAVEVKNEVIKRLISYNLLDEMKKQNINKTEMAKKMSTSRAALDRLLNPYNDSVTLATLTKAANVLGKKLVLQLQ